MKYYILANGEGTRWHNYKGVPKQLIQIEGESILARMVRLLNQEGVKKDDIIICGPFTVEGSNWSVITKSPTKREVFEEIAELAKEPFTILYGDVYYTEACIKEIVHRPINKFDEFLCATPNPNTGCTWPEGYAHRCEDWQWWLDKMRELNNGIREGKINYEKDWYLHFWFLDNLEGVNTFPDNYQYDQDHDVYWCDNTDDFDYPEDLTKFCEHTGLKCTNEEEL